MRAHVSWRFRIFSLIVLVPLSSTAAASSALDNAHSALERVVRSDAEALASLASETDAIALFNARLGQAVGLPSLDRTLRESAGQPDGMKPAVDLTAELAAWSLAVALRQAGNSQSAAALVQLQPRLLRQHWLLAARPDLSKAVPLVDTLIGIPSGGEQADSTRFAGYAEFLDRTYPDLAGGTQSWLGIAQQSGRSGIEQRLRSFWDGHAPDPEAETWMGRYFESRLRPVLRAELVSLAIRAEALAQASANIQFSTLQSWAERARQRKSLARLCGTWQWTVHNHQNHQDHKMAVSFPPPDMLESAQFTGMRPATILIHGDSVYLRWEFQGGVQEDSLLFAGEGQRLEGTFTNSAGAWGSITGKRIAGCEAREKR